MEDADDSGMEDADTFSESTAKELAEKNPIDMERETFPLNMSVSEASTKRGFSKLNVAQYDVDFERTSFADGGFLGRIHGWER